VNLRYQPPKPKSGSGQGGGSGAGGSGGAEGRGGAGRGAGSGGRSGSKGQGKRGSSPQQGKGVPKSKRSSNKGGGSRSKSRASRAPTTQLDASWRIKADWPALVSTAASFDLDMPETILGSGECGYVFGCRCGAPTHLLHCSIARCRDSVRCQQAPELNCQVLGHVPCEV
jgi:hypothetical protein